MTHVRPRVRPGIDHGAAPRAALRGASRATPDAALAAIATLAMTLLVAPPALAQSPTPVVAPRSVVVTTPIMGSLVRDLVGDRATVTVLMANGIDPHEWSPSARDIEVLHAADLVVANGLDLEAALGDALEEVEASGIGVFRATDHVLLRGVDPEQPVGDDQDHDDGPTDPHIWVDPVAMRDVALALAPALASVAVDVGERATDLAARLDALDAEVRALVDTVPPESRKLVTGHESMGYFADRYGFELVGAVIPGLSSQGEVSARELAEVAERIRAVGVRVLFTELGTPQSVVDAIAGETGASVVELSTHTLPADGSYLTFMRVVAQTVVGALAAAAAT